MFNQSGALPVSYHTALIENLDLICRTLNAIVETIQWGGEGEEGAWPDLTCDYYSDVAL